MTITTRTQAIDFLVAEGKPLAMARVAVNEAFNQIPVENDKDELRMVVSPNESLIINEVSEESVLAAYDEVISSDFDSTEDGIFILDELKYDLEGDLIVAEQLQNAPSTDTQQ